MTESRASGDLQKPAEESKGKMKETEAFEEGAHIEGFQQLEGVKFLRPGVDIGPQSGKATAVSGKGTAVSGKPKTESENFEEGAHLEGFQQLEGVKFLRPGVDIGPQTGTIDSGDKSKSKSTAENFEEGAHLEGFQQLEGVEFLRPGVDLGTQTGTDSWKGKESWKETEDWKGADDKKGFQGTEEWKGREARQETAWQNRADIQGMRDKEKQEEIMETLEGDRQLVPESGNSSEESIESVDEKKPEGDVSKVMFPTTHVPAQGARPLKGTIIPEEALDKAKLEELNRTLDTEVDKKSQEPYVAMPSQQVINETIKADMARDAARDLQSEGKSKDIPSS